MIDRPRADGSIVLGGFPSWEKRNANRTTIGGAEHDDCRYGGMPVPGNGSPASPRRYRVDRFRTSVRPTDPGRGALLCLSVVGVET